MAYLEYFRNLPVREEVLPEGEAGWLPWASWYLIFLNRGSIGQVVDAPMYEKWKTRLNENFTYVYNISNYKNTLYITGLKEGDFIFASSGDNGANWKETVLNEDISLENGLPICVGFINTREGLIGVKASFRLD